MKKLILWLITNVLILIGVPILYYIYLERLVDYEYATGIRTSTGGDIILIPVVSSFIFLFVTLLIINVFLICYFWLRRRRRLA
jgi:hypothetical protein